MVVGLVGNVVSLSGYASRTHFTPACLRMFQEREYEWRSGCRTTGGARRKAMNPRILCSLMLIPFTSTGETWKAKCLAGPPEINPGSCSIEIASNLVIVRRKKASITIAPESISGVYYRSDTFRRSRAVDLDLRHYGPDPSGGMGFVYAAACLTALALHPLKGVDHFATIFWDSGDTGQSISVQLGKRDYAVVMASLERLTGQDWRRQDPLAAVLGVDRNGLDVQLDRETAVGPVILAPGSYRIVFTRARPSEGFVVLFSGAPGQRIPVAAALAESLPSEEVPSGAAVQYGTNGNQGCVACINLPSLVLHIVGCRPE